MKQKRKNNKKSEKSQLTDGEIDTKVTEILKLRERGLKNDLKICIHLADLIDDAKARKHARVLEMYAAAKWTPSEAQRLAKVGRRFRDEIEGGNVAAFPISHLKILSTMKNTALADLIVAENMDITVRDLAYAKANEARFEDCKNLDEIESVLEDRKSTSEEVDDSGGTSKKTKFKAEPDADRKGSKLMKLEVTLKDTDDAKNPEGIRSRLKRVRDDIREISSRIKKTKIRDQMKDQISELLKEIKKIASSVEI